MTSTLNGNGYRRRQVRARVLAEEEHCALCGRWIDQSLHYLDARAAVVDEIVPRSRGGSAYERANCALMCRACNRWKSAMTLDEAKAKLNDQPMAEPMAQAVEASDIW